MQKNVFLSVTCVTIYALKSLGVRETSFEIADNVERNKCPNVNNEVFPYLCHYNKNF